MIPDTLDLLTISVRAGLGFDAALGKVVEKLKGPLSDEFRRALAEVRVGKARRDALRDIVPRTEVPPLTNFIGAIIQAEQLGVSITKVLQVQSEQLRIERRQRAEEMAAKAPIKMLFPLVGCIFPSLFIVILGPGDHPDRPEPDGLSLGDRRRAADRGDATRLAPQPDARDGPGDRAGGGRGAVGQVHGPDGPAVAPARRRPVAARQQRDPHDVHALPDRRGVRAAGATTAGSCRCVSVHRGLRAWTGSCRWSAAPTACWSSRSGTIDRTATAVGDTLVLEPAAT